MDVNPLLKYVMKAKKEDVAHSSAYAMAQNKDGIGVASTSSFDERMKIDGNRQVIKKYRDSQIASGSINNRPKAKVYTPPETGGETTRYGVVSSAEAGSRSALGPKPAPGTNTALGAKPAAGAKPALGPKPMPSSARPVPPRNPGISR